MGIRRRDLLAYGGALLLGGCADWFKGSDSGGTGGGPTEPDLPTVDPEFRTAPSPIGYSNVAYLTHHSADYILGHGMTIVQAEAVPFDEDISTFDILRLKRIADVCRQRSATFFVTLVNWNGRRQREASTSWFRDRVRQISQEVGPSQVWFESVSEPDQSPKANEWQRIAAEEWPGFLVGNGPGGRGTPAVRSDLVDWHYCSYDDMARNIGNGGRLHSTDCTPVLASNLNERQVREVTRKAVASRAKLILYDTNNTPTQNDRVIKWMGEEIQRG